jgi:hypothetical protein
MNRYIKRIDQIVEQKMSSSTPKKSLGGLLSPKKEMKGMTTTSRKENVMMDRIANYVLDIRKMRMGIKQNGD